jgi:hypothetical protein
MIWRYFWCALVALCLAIAPAIARADASCDSGYAQTLARQGYAALDSHRYNDARSAAGELALYARGCDDPKIGYPSVVYSAYIGSAAFHGMGDDTRASQALQAGMVVLGLLKKDGGYDGLVSAMEPKFIALSHELKVVAPPPALPGQPPGSQGQNSASQGSGSP